MRMVFVGIIGKIVDWIDEVQPKSVKEIREFLVELDAKEEQRIRRDINEIK